MGAEEIMLERSTATASSGRVKEKCFLWEIKTGIIVCREASCDWHSLAFVGSSILKCWLSSTEDSMVVFHHGCVFTLNAFATFYHSKGPGGGRSDFEQPKVGSRVRVISRTTFESKGASRK